MANFANVMILVCDTLMPVPIIITYVTQVGFHKTILEFVILRHIL